jgi:hypothetical protein
MYNRRALAIKVASRYMSASHGMTLAQFVEGVSKGFHNKVVFKMTGIDKYEGMLRTPDGVLHLEVEPSWRDDFDVHVHNMTHGFKYTLSGLERPEECVKELH